MIINFLGGICAYYITKLIDNKFNIKAKKEEEIREIKRKRYEEFIEIIEKILARKEGISAKQFLDELNLVYSRMFISVPDPIVKIIKKEINEMFDAHKRKKIYLAIRKDLLGRTGIQEDDLCYFSEKAKKE